MGFRRILGGIVGAVMAGGGAVAYASNRGASPELFLTPQSIGEELAKSCACLNRPYIPTWWMRAGHLQTVLGVWIRSKPDVTYRREMFKLADGGQLALDWTEDPSFDESTPTILIFPGLTASSSNKYIRHVAANAKAAKVRALVFNYRGHNYELTSPKASSAACVHEIKEVIEHVHATHPSSPLVAVGFSMGANMLCKYLGSWGRETCCLKGAISIANPFDFRAIADLLKRPPNLGYNWFLCHQLKKNLFTRKHNVDMMARVEKIKMDTALKATTIWDLDETLSRHMYGDLFKNVEDYYEKSSSKPYIKHVNIPCTLR
eukprot:gnl/Hemi2/25236_TR8489_c0_g1_i1.p1 gnl/Hemi2/25236_TR8489_c0_g1~~gnl/Hemi2/25236_TR8489_c0_g1_i1.p1  ORF type:complete len:318 (+),score=57.08 gnl/Hemi2/25236_TR8489_c0_g1_i1:108-1061(+)